MAVARQRMEVVALADSAADKQAVKKLQTGMLLGGIGLLALGVWLLAVLGESLWGFLSILPLLVGVLWVAAVCLARSFKRYGTEMQLPCLQHGFWYGIEAALKIAGIWGLLLLAVWVLQWLSGLG